MFPWPLHSRLADKDGYESRKPRQGKARRDKIEEVACTEGWDKRDSRLSDWVRGIGVEPEGKCNAVWNEVEKDLKMALYQAKNKPWQIFLIHYHFITSVFILSYGSLKTEKKNCDSFEFTWLCFSRVIISLVSIYTKIKREYQNTPVKSNSQRSVIVVLMFSGQSKTDRWQETSDRWRLERD